MAKRSVEAAGSKRASGAKDSSKDESGNWDCDELCGPKVDWMALAAGDRMLYSAYLLPDPELTRKEYGLAYDETSDLKAIAAGAPVVSVGKPIYVPVDKKLLTEAGIAISQEVALQKKKGYGFGYVKLVCAFTNPSRNYFVSSGRMDVRLGLVADSKGEAMVYDWIPKEVTDESTVTRGFKITPNLGFVEGTAEASNQIEFKHLQPRISYEGGQSDWITWHYMTTRSTRQIQGGRESRMIVRLPKRTRELKIKIDVQATVGMGLMEKYIKNKIWPEPPPEGLRKIEEEGFVLSRSRKIVSGGGRLAFGEGVRLSARTSLTDDERTSSIML